MIRLLLTLSRVLDYGLGILTLSNSQFERMEKVQNEGMRTILECTRDNPVVTLRHKLGWSSKRSRYMKAQIKAYMHIICDSHNPLNGSINYIK